MRYGVGVVFSGMPYATVYLFYQFKRFSNFYVSSLVLPSLLVAVVVWLGMFIDPKAVPARIGIIITSVLVQVALRIPVSSMLPVVDYSTWIGDFQM